MFIETLEKLCIRENISIAKMTSDLGLATGIVSNWKKRGTLPSGEVLLKIADYFHCSVDYLLGRNNLKEVVTNNNSLKKTFRTDEINISEVFDLNDDAKSYYFHIFEAYNELCNANELFIRILNEQEKTPDRTFEWTMLLKYVVVTTYETCALLNLDTKELSKFKSVLSNIITTLKIEKEYGDFKKIWDANGEFFRDARNICVHFDHERNKSKEIYYTLLEKVKTIQINTNIECLTSDFNHQIFIGILNTIYEKKYINDEKDKKENYYAEYVNIFTDAINSFMPILKPIICHIYFTIFESNGAIEQMLKAEKYRNSLNKETVHGEIAAYGGKITGGKPKKKPETTISKYFLR